MTDKNGKKQQGKIMIHPILGKMMYDHYDDVWRPVFSAVLKVSLWGRIFEAVPEFISKDIGQWINSH